MRGILLLATLICATPHVADAQSRSRHWAWCRGESLVRLLRGCTALINSGRETPGDLARAYFNRGRGLSDSGQYDRAIQNLDQAIWLDPDYPDAFNSRAIAREGKGEYDQAIRDFDQAVLLDPNFAIALYNRALAFQATGQPEKAKVDFARAREAGPRLTEAKE